MALAHFQRTFTDAAGNIKPGLAVTVRRESDNGLAALFADAGSVTAKSNPFNTDANGYGSFYVVDGRYRIQATDIDWRNEDLVSQPDLAASIATNTAAILDRVIRVTSISAMAAYSAPVGYVFSLNAGGRSGVFDVVAGDFSAELAADTLNGVYVGLADNPTATTKVLKRRYLGEIWTSFFGTKSDGATDDTLAFQAAIDFSEANKAVTVRVDDGVMVITDTLSVLYNGAQIVGTCENYGAASHFSQNLLFAGRSTISFVPTTEKDLFLLGDTGTRGQSIKNINLFGNTKPSDFHIAKGPIYPTTLNSRYGINVRNSLFSTFENMAIRGFKTGIRSETTQSNTFSNIYINYCREQCVLYDAGMPTSDVYRSCFFRTTPIGVNNIGTTLFLNVRFITCLFEELDRWGMSLDRTARAIEVINCYGERTGDDPGQTDQAMFRVGHTGTGDPDVTKALQVTGGHYGGNVDVKPTFLDVDACYGVTLDSPFYGNYGTVIKTTANTEDKAIFISGLRGRAALTTFHNGDDERVLVGTYEQRALNDNVSKDSIITRTDELLARLIKNKQPTFIATGIVKQSYIRQVETNGGGTVLKIPILSQGFLNLASIIKIWGQSARINDQQSLPFSATLSFGSLTSISNFSMLQNVGNIASAAVVGMNLEITFTTAYTDGLLLDLEFLSKNKDLVVIDSLDLTA